MSLRNRLVLPVILSTLALLAGCGSSTKNPVPPPTGGFTNLNFNGTYTFSVFGTDGFTYAAAGSFTACGCTGGTISGGTVDLTDATTGAPLAGHRLDGHQQQHLQHYAGRARHNPTPDHERQSRLERPG